ncbi:hypothetical protein KSP40_PGU020692 [Platanthera guangdongensis]|uniref:Uncharacterized protein n=1 Tax=Platanthera guangdongensis TaxID=2320717 RepID=A0ABR2N5S7_9ASPA
MAAAFHRRNLFSKPEKKSCGGDRGEGGHHWEKVSSDIAEGMPPDGDERLKNAILFVEKAAKEVAEEAHLTQDIMHNVQQRTTVGMAAGGTGAEMQALGDGARWRGRSDKDR